MKKVKFYSDDALDFHKDVLKAKRNTKDDPTYKKRMEDREDTISAQFTEYDSRFAANTLEGMSVVKLTSSQIADFLRLYRYKDKCFQDLEEKLSVDENGHEYPYCPMCEKLGVRQAGVYGCGDYADRHRRDFGLCADTYSRQHQ